MEKIDSKELEKSISHKIINIIEYLPNAVVSKTILRRPTGNVTVCSLAAGEELGEKSVPFDTFTQIIDGAADLVINQKQFRIGSGEGIVIPAHASHYFNASEQFKMITTVIKSGYEGENVLR